MAVLAINGGDRTCDIEWPSWPVWSDEEREGINAVLESGKWWQGEKVQEFERKFAEFQDARYGVAASSGTTALETALRALNVGPGDEVIIPPYTFMATASAVFRVNAVPVFADIDGNTLCIDPDDVERKITPKTKVIMPVHLAGHVADMDRLTHIAAKHGLKILEDACHSWGSKWKGRGTGALGHCGVFSFQSSKNITSGEGGIILTDDEALADLCWSYTNCGRIPGGAWYEHQFVGSNLRLTEFQAAVLLGQLSRLESHTLLRQANAELLNGCLRSVPGIRVIQIDTRVTRRSYHFYPFRLDIDRLGVSLRRFAEALQAEGVPAHPGYPMPLYKNPAFQTKSEGPAGCPLTCPYYGREVDYSSVCCPMCEQACTDTCTIPHWLLLSHESAMHAIAKAIRKIVDNIEELKQPRC